MDAAKEVWPSLLKDLSRLFECVRIIGDRKLWWWGGGGVYCDNLDHLEPLS
jgi:hypothetical protein